MLLALLQVCPSLLGFPSHVAVNLVFFAPVCFDLPYVVLIGCSPQPLVLIGRGVGCRGIYYHSREMNGDFASAIRTP